MECVNPLRAHHRARYRYCCYQRCSLCICIIVAGYASITSLGSSPCPTNPAISICIHFYTCFTYTDRWFSTLSFLLPAEKEDPKSALRQATYTVSRPHCIPFLLSRPMIVHVRTIEMMVLKSVRLRSRPSGLKLSCINFSILKRSDMACVSTPRARVTDACKCVSANLRLPPAAAGTRSDGCDAQANRQ
jgi:hypothetical protein